jgi:hypothetical protein
MKDKPLPDELRELLWRGRLTDAERARVVSQPEGLAEVELEGRLNEALARLPGVSVSSNFTARVMQAVEREDVRSRAGGGRWFWPRWLPRVAVTAVVAAFAAVSWQHHEITAQRSAIARSIVQVTASSPLPGVEALDNFEAIQRMGQAQSADEKLLALLQ